MKRFKDFKEGETLWVFYNENYKEDLDKFHAKYSILPITIESNKEIIIERTSGGWWEDSIAIKEKSNHIKFKFLNFDYERYYDNYFDDLNKMSITSNLWQNGPNLELFVNKNDAEKYLCDFCKQRIKQLFNDIKLKENQINLLKDSIKEYE